MSLAALPVLFETSLQHLAKLVVFQHAAIFLAKDVDTDQEQSLTLFVYRQPTLSLWFTLSDIPVSKRPLAQTALAVWSRFNIPVTQANQMILPALAAIEDKRWPTMLKAAKTHLCAPLVAGDRALGYLLLMHDEKDAYQAVDSDIVNMFANQLAIASDSIRVVERVKATAVINERKRLSRDLHDSVSQQLHTASLIAETLPGLWHSHPQVANAGLDDLRLLILGALANMRGLLWDLQATELADQPLDFLLHRLTEMMDLYTETEMFVEITGKANCPLPKNVHLALYRIFQESLNNIIKHADACQTRIYLHRKPAEVILRIYDDGKGFNRQEIPKRGLGIRFMHQRAQEIGASLNIESRSGRGTKVEVTWSYPKRGDGP